MIGHQHVPHDGTPEGEETTAGTREQVEALAAWMGWKKSRISPLVPASRHSDKLRWWVEGGAPIANVAEWNPFADANADVQVLERAREVWRHGEGEVWLLWSEFGFLLRREWSMAPSPYADLDGDPGQYRVGDYSRAVLQVLATTEGPAR